MEKDKIKEEYKYVKMHKKYDLERVSEGKKEGKERTKEIVKKI